MIYTNFNSRLGTPFGIISSSCYDEMSDLYFTTFVCESELVTDDMFMVVGRFLLNENTNTLYYYEDPYTPLNSEEVGLLSHFLKEEYHISSTTRVKSTLDEYYERYNEVV